MIQTRTYPINGADLTAQVKEAVRILRKGGLVVFPTETVYGLAVDPERGNALKRVYKLKGRKQSKALTLQVASIKKALKLIRQTAPFEDLAEAFWPGPLTLIANSRKKGKTVGIRIPRHDFALKLLRAYGKPLAVTSVNASQEQELWRKRELLSFLDKKAELIFFQNMKPKSSSTVVDVTGAKPVVKREGPIRLREIMRIAGCAE